MFDKVVVPLDGSALSESVLAWVRQLVARADTRVYLVRVVPHVQPAVVYDGAVAVPLPGPGPQEQQQDALLYLERTAERFGPEADIRSLVRTGAPAPEIVAAARECGADLIAMSTHGRTGLGRLVLGSVADEVVRISGMPVLVLRPDTAATAAQ